MPCYTQLAPKQTVQERATEVRKAVETLNKALATGKVRPVVGPQGAVTFVNWNDSDRNRVTDACAYRRIMATGSALAKQQIARAEALAGRSVDRKVVAQGVHSHDGGRSWHGKG